MTGEQIVYTPDTSAGALLRPELAWALTPELGALKVLIGPATEEVFRDHIGPPPYPCQVRCFRLPTRIGVSMMQVHDELAGWEPDVVLYLEPGNQPLLADLHRVPYPLVGFGSDWQWSIGRVREVAALFDWLLLDQRGCDLARAAGVQNVSAAYRYGSFHPGEDVASRGSPTRDIDVSLVSHYTLPFHFERRRLLWRVASRLGARRRLLFAEGMYRARYRDVIRRSKVVLMNCLRREFAYRALEALAGGALFMCEEDNLEIRRFLEPGVHFVTFTHDDVVDRLEHYLHDDEARERIAAAGRDKVASYAYPFPLAFYCQQVLSLGLPRLRAAARERLRRKSPTSWVQALGWFRDGRSAGRAYLGAAHLLTERPTDGGTLDLLRARNLLGLCYLGLAQKVKVPADALDLRRKARETLGTNLEDLRADAAAGRPLPEEVVAIATFNLGEAAHACDEHETAGPVLRQALELFRRIERIDPQGSWPDALQVSITSPQFFFHAFAHGSRWDELSSRYRDLLVAWCEWRLGELATAQGRAAIAFEHFERWYALVEPSFRERNAAAIRAGVEAGELDRALALARRVLDQAPLEPELWLLCLELHERARPPGWRQASLELIDAALATIQAMPQLSEVEGSLRERRVRLSAPE